MENGMLTGGDGLYGYTHCAHTFSDILKADVAPGLKCRFQSVKRDY